MATKWLERHTGSETHRLPADTDEPAHQPSKWCWCDPEETMRRNRTVWVHQPLEAAQEPAGTLS